MGSQYRPVRGPDELPGEKHNVCLPIAQVRLGLLGLGDHPDRTDRQVRVRLLQSFCIWDLGRERVVNTVCDIQALQRTRLIPRADRDLLLDPIPTRAAVDQVDTELLQLADEDLALFDAPLLPLSTGVLLRTFGPFGGADAVEERLVPGGAEFLRDSQGPAHAVLERAAVLVGADVGERGEELVLKVSVRAVYLDEVIWRRSGLSV